MGSCFVEFVFSEQKIQPNKTGRQPIQINSGMKTLAHPLISDVSIEILVGKIKPGNK